MVGRVQAFLKDKSSIRRILPNAEATAIVQAIEQAGRAAHRLAAPYGRRTLLAALVAQVRLGDTQIGVTIDSPALARTIGIDVLSSVSLVLTVPATKVRKGKAVKLVLTSDDSTSSERDDALVALVAEAQAARKAVLGSPDSTIKELAGSLGQCRHRFSKLVRLSYLAPEIVGAIVAGRQPTMLTARKLLSADLPLCWQAQKQLLGIG